ncbi:DUF2842 domain-containing protein [Altererythrobacter sp.]|nr:DUF2842 domain-containing protein [Altererythrobacter sp.]
MRDEPTWRIPVGMLGLILCLTVYAIVIARYVPEIIGGWHAIFQTAVYFLLGVVWLLPLRRFLIWMETGNRK